MINYNIFAYAATGLGITIQIPQIIKILVTKSAKDLSYVTIFFGGTNQILWGTFAYYDKTYPVLYSSLGNECIWIILLTIKLYYDLKKKNIINIEPENI